MKIGAELINGECKFTVWSPLIEKISLKIISPNEITIPMKQDNKGYFSTTVSNISHGACYKYTINDDKDRPDPASNFQPDGVHGASMVIDHNSFVWDDKWFKPVPLNEMIIYELHIGTFTKSGTFIEAIERLQDLKNIGINTIELMPIAQFPGERNWGYDGVNLFAVQNSYGGVDGLKTFINAAHKLGISVILDVVYNHLGPEGNYLWDYAPYFTSKYKTPWSDALNFDSEYSYGARNHFVQNALFWFETYHIDGLRLDAVHAIFDMSARHILREISENVAALSDKMGKKLLLIAESNLNDPKYIRPIELGGYGMDAQWCDDFHHALHAFITKESDGYYVDFGDIDKLAKTFKHGYVYTGQYSKFRKRIFGDKTKDRNAKQFIIFAQNHDQIGNRMLGERLSNLTTFSRLKIIAALTMVSPFVPMLFMGEEYGEDAPFLFFTNHADADLIKGVREGRKEEFKTFAWKGTPPDPQDIDTFNKSKLNWSARNSGKHKLLLDFYKQLIRFRTDIPALSNLDMDCIDAVVDKGLLIIKRWHEESCILCIINFNDEIKTISQESYGIWKKILDSDDISWGGNGIILQDTNPLYIAGESVVIYLKED